ncbi:glycosyltransferase family 2 protein [Methanomassiliicoccus luminyensis]|uniref:glycosyltransferase family 2 protein n=1 Tax=Methanomassiliicoccus luminyensis TaxID=1080712 RepID=UPI0011CBC883|nr:glycosyltransferase family A protein [Methanomassiliicoccus luminyensis]
MWLTDVVLRRSESYRKNLRFEPNLARFVAKYGSRPVPSRERDLTLEIIIPCYNHGRFLRDALSSCPRDAPITISYDESTDDTGEIIERLKDEFTFKLLKNGEAAGQGESINRAIAASDHDAFMVLNADDCLLPYAYDAVARTFDRFPDARLVGGGSIPFADPSTLRLSAHLPVRLGYLHEATVLRPEQVRRVKELNDVNMTMSSCSFTRSAWKAVDGFWPFDRRVCSHDDRDFQLRVGCLFPIALIEEPLAFYRTNSSLARGQA